MNFGLNSNKQKKQRILHLTSVFEIGGLQRLIAHFVRYDSKYNQHHLAILRSSTEGLKLFNREIAVELYQGLADDEILIRLKDFITENSIDIIIAHNRHTWDVAVDILEYKPDIRLFFIAHSAIKFRRIFENESEAEIRIRHNSLYTEKIICTSGFIESKLKILFPAEKEKIIRIHNGVEIQKLDGVLPRKKIRDLIGIKDDFVLIGLVSRLAPVKNIGFLLNAISHLIKAGECKFKVLIIGDGPEQINLQEQIRQLNLGNYVILKESNISLEDYYNTFDIYVNCSLFESCSMAILEAMSHGLPVVASDVGGNSELVLDGETGYTFSLDHQDEFIDKTKILLRNSQLRSQFGNNAYVRAVKNFNILDVLHKYQVLFDMGKEFPIEENKSDLKEVK
jgi:glycosyltransferase involved in cell wall biosynthesis